MVPGYHLPVLAELVILALLYADYMDLASISQVGMRRARAFSA